MALFGVNEVLTLNTGRTPLALGDAVRQAKAAISNADVRRTWVLFGDPSYAAQIDATFR